MIEFFDDAGLREEIGIKNVIHIKLFKEWLVVQLV